MGQAEGRPEKICVRGGTELRERPFFPHFDAQIFCILLSVALTPFARLFSLIGVDG